MSRCPGKNSTEVILILTSFDRNDRGTTDGIRNVQQAHIGIRSLSNEILHEDRTDAAAEWPYFLQLMHNGLLFQTAFVPLDLIDFHGGVDLSFQRGVCAARKGKILVIANFSSLRVLDGFYPVCPGVNLLNAVSSPLCCSSCSYYKADL
ncbi:hypothetical protein HNY73_013878 [Argiope bruennichi]|uniref:Uncharacterized protein n=1 Tax=Argiope bruennichi TaxID=94029 RepID=A0A8T0ENU1_ARGBR|nr:hypothetical protein HNY73_013878 [Argiope bruennichi]